MGRRTILPKSSRVFFVFAIPIWLALMSISRTLYQVTLTGSDNKPRRITSSSSSSSASSASGSLTLATSATSTTKPTTAIINPLCNVSGTHYFFDGNYHHHPDGNSFRRALAEGVYNGIYNDTPHFHHQQSHTTSMGLMYAVSGTKGFVKYVFAPVVEHLRGTVGIPNVVERRREGRQRHRQPPQQWGLAMDPFACNLLSQPSEDHSPILPFFDVLVIITPEDMQQRLSSNNNIRLFDPIEHRKIAKAKNRTNFYRRFKSSRTNNTFMGVVSWGDKRNENLRFYAMGFKILAFQAAPFPITSFIDVDLVPCRKDFDVHLREHIQERVQSQNYSLFDVAVTDVQTKYRLKYPSHEDPLHYMLRRRFNTSMSNKSDDSNIHNTMCTVLNMTSPRTRDLLKRATEHYFESPETPEGKTKQNDQPAFGEAMYDTWKFYRSTNSNNTDGNFDSGFRHVDMSTDRICRNANIGKRRAVKVCPKPGEGGANQCLLVHKTTGEREPRNRRREMRRKKRAKAKLN